MHDAPGNKTAMINAPSLPDPSLLQQLVEMKMPFGKYKGTLICDLPTFYLEYFARKGFPAGKMGMLLSTMHEIRQNGLDNLLRPLRKRN
ncbi:MAG: hypothetical protein FD123_2762 [Bacteroidetes bacterium]|nr:MAG: hypothetical protein FD123_2762 [Bacteroidota bacterium]